MTPHQPYRAGQTRPQTMALAAMLQGRTLHGHNPMDARRAMMRRLALMQMLARRG